MCLISGITSSVSNTEILVASVNDDRQFTAYKNQVTMKSNGTMVIPFPNHDRNCELVDLSNYKLLFKDLKEFVLESYKVTNSTSIPIADIHDNPQNHRSEFTQYLLSFTNTKLERALLCVYNNTSYIIRNPFKIYHHKNNHKSNMCLFEIETNSSGTTMYITDCIKYNNHDISTFNYTIRMRVASMFKDIPTRPYFYHHQHQELINYCTLHNIKHFKYLYIPLVHSVKPFNNPFLFTIPHETKTKHAL
jgi:hypothetical protein